MWLFLSRRLWMWLLLAIGGPLLSRLFNHVGDRIEARRGPTRFSRLLRWGGRRAERGSRGPLAHRHP